jgi:hypothetical protein
MPMYGRGLRQMIPNVDAHVIALPEAQFRSGDLPIEGVGVNGDTRKDSPPNDGRIEFKYLDDPTDILYQFDREYTSLV